MHKVGGFVDELHWCRVCWCVDVAEFIFVGVGVMDLGMGVVCFGICCF